MHAAALQTLASRRLALTARLVEDAEQPTLKETLARVEERSGGRVPLADAADTVRSEREAR